MVTLQQELYSRYSFWFLCCDWSFLVLTLSTTSTYLHLNIIYGLVLRFSSLCTANRKFAGFTVPSFLLTFNYKKRIEPLRKKTTEESQTPCLSRAKILMGCSVLDRCGPAALTSHLLSWVFLLSWMFQFSESTSAQWAMVMATGQNRSRPGGPYITSGPRRISQPSSVWTLNTPWHTHTEKETHCKRYIKRSCGQQNDSVRPVIVSFNGSFYSSICDAGKNCTLYA